MLHYSFRLQIMKKNMQNFGSRHLENWVILRQIFFMQRKVRMQNGQICMSEWLRKLKKKAFRSSQHNLEVLEQLKRCMRKDIVHCLRM